MRQRDTRRAFRAVSAGFFSLVKLCQKGGNGKKRYLCRAKRPGRVGGASPLVRETRMKTMIRKYFIFLLLSGCALAARPQDARTVSGRIVDEVSRPVAEAVVVMQTPDSAFVAAAVSDAEGRFALPACPERWRLVVQHLSYRPQVAEGTGADAGTVVLQSGERSVGEVVVEAGRPAVKVEDGRLTYDLEQVARDKVVNDTYEALQRLPGVQEEEGRLTLAGAGEVTVILNGKPSTMDAGQLETLLRNTPVSRVEKVEVMYSTPPQYHVRGASLNVVLKRPDDYSSQGEVSAEYVNKYYSEGGVTGNYRFTTPKLALDVMYGFGRKHTLQYYDMYSRHTLDGEVHSIEENEQMRGKNYAHDMRMAGEYRFGKDNGIDLSYTGSFVPEMRSNARTTGNFQTTGLDGCLERRMHNVALHFRAGFGLDVGADYTRYTNDDNRQMIADYAAGGRDRFSLSGGQRIDRYNVHADRERKLSGGWELGYGASYSHTRNSDFQTYSEVEGGLATPSTDSELKERTVDFYLSLGKRYAGGMSWSASATGEYYSIGSYRKWAFFPQASLTYMKSPRHILQLSFSTQKVYPAYWEMKPSVGYLNGYSEIWRSPGLRPQTDYNVNANYVVEQKYVFGAFFIRMKDEFMQTAYQSTERLALIYKTTNWNYAQYAGIMASVPFTVGMWWESSLTVTGQHARHRCDDFFDIPFDRKKWFSLFRWDNTFKVNRHLVFELRGFVQTPAIQGTFDLKTAGSADAGVKWTFAGDKAELSARCDDIFNTGRPESDLRYRGQDLRMENAFYLRTFTLNFRFRFGGYKEKKVKAVDTSRFGH